MKLFRAGRSALLALQLGLCLILIPCLAHAQAVSTTTVQGTVYLANGQPASGTVSLSWPAFTTAAGQAVAAGQLTLPIAADGFVSANLAPNLGATPAGLFYTAIYQMSDGTTSTEYWVVPAAAQASIGQVRAQLMPAAQAVQAVNKSYVDQSLSQLTQSLLTASGGNLTGPLTLAGDPTQPLQAADKHYVDASVAQSLPLAGGAVTGPLTARQLGAALQVDQLSGADFGAKLQTCLGMVSATNGGTCDARNFSGTQSMGSNLTISTANVIVLLPCATVSTPNQIIVAPGTRNVSLRGCALRGGSLASGSQGGTAFLYAGAAAMVQVGDPAYLIDTPGFHLDNILINTTSATSANAGAIKAWRTQELDLESLYLVGNSNQTGVTLDGTGNYTGGTFYDLEIGGYQTAINSIGHQIANTATTDWVNASTFVRLHIDCPTANGTPIAGTYGINLQQGDGNTFTGGDVEGCSTALHLGPNAQNNTILGLRNENSTSQVIADAGSSYNDWITGGTLFTGQLTDNGTRNSFQDTFHRAFNGMNGDWYGSQKDATVTNHFRLGIGSGNERGLLDRYQTDYGYRWTTGLTDAIAGEQYFEILDELNNVDRVSIGQYNNGQASTNNQTAINSAGTGAVLLNGSNNSGTGGVVFGSGGPTETTVATVSNTGNAQFNGTLQVGSTSQSTGTMTVRNNADAEVDYYLWPGATTSQKGSYTYKDFNGNSQWYMVKDASNNWALNSATGGLDSIKAYQSTNSGDTYIDASNSSGVVRVNYETGSGSGFNVYGGNSGLLYASFTAANAIKFPGLAASSGHDCLQIDDSGYVTNTGSACGTGSGSGGTSGTINSGTSGQIAYYNAAGTTLAGMSAVPLVSGGTGATTAAAALANLGAAALSGATFAGQVNAQSVAGQFHADQMQSPPSTGNNGIAMSLAQCASQAYVCSILAPALYSQAEAPPWGNLSAMIVGLSAMQGPTAAQPIASVQDMRFGVPQWYFNSSVQYPGNNRFFMPPLFSMSTINAPQGINSTITPALELQNFSFGGGRNFYTEKTNLATLMMNSWRYTQSQNSGDMLQNEHCIGNGDCVGHDIETISYGGPSTQADEGNESTRYMAYEQGIVFQANLASVTAGSDGTSTIATTSAVNPGTQGEDRILIDLSQKISGTISTIANVGGNATVTCTGCTFPASGTSTQTTLTATVQNPPGYTNVFPQSNLTLQVTSSAGFATGQQVCIFDYNYECEKITAVSAGAITIAIDRIPHPVGAYVVTGGLTGYAWEAEADRVVPGSTNGVSIPIDSNLASTIRKAIPIMMSNSSAGTVTLFGGYNYLPGTSMGSYSGRAYQAMGAGGAVSLTVSNGAVTGCSASGGSGYAGQNAPPQINITGTWTTAPAVTAWGNGALTNCAVVTPGTGISGTPTTSIVANNPFDIYPAAKVVSVYNAATGKVDGTLYTEPLSGTFSNGDLLEEPHYFLQKLQGMNNGVGAYITGYASQSNQAINYTMGGIWQNQDSATFFNVTSDPSLYQGSPTSSPWILGRGQLIPPQGHTLNGPFSSGLRMSMPPFGPGLYSYLGSGAVVVQCGGIPCSSWTNGYNFLVGSNGLGGASAGQDVFSYNPSNTTWSLTAGGINPNGGSPAATYSFNATGVSFGATGSATANRTLANLGGEGPVANILAYGAVSGSDSTAAIQAAINAYGNNATVIIPPGTYIVSSKISVPFSNVTIRAEGGVIKCSVTPDNYCIEIGGVTAGLNYANDVLQNLRIQPGSLSKFAAIHDNGYDLQIYNPGFNPDTTDCAGYCYFSNLMQVEIDEQFHLDGLLGQSVNKAIECDSTQCGSVVYATANAAVGWISNSNFSTQCAGNDIDWQSGNDIHLDSVIMQGFPEFAFRYSAGSDGRVLASKVHVEAGGCSNPALNGLNASVGYLMNGGILQSDQGELGGNIPQFNVTGSGSSSYAYYVVVTNANGLKTAPMLAGYVTNGPASFSASNNVQVTWASVPAATSCDLLRIPNYTTNTLPAIGTGNWAVATGLSCSANSFTAYTDTNNAPASYTLSTSNTNAPYMPLWVGSVVLNGTGALNSYTQATFQGSCTPGSRFISSNPLNGQAFPQVVCSGATEDDFAGDTVPYSPAFITRMGGWVPYSSSATLLGGMASVTSNLKGSLNLLQGGSNGPTDTITVLDSAPGTTFGLAGNRPAASANDAAIGIDQNTAGMSLRDSTSLSQYIGHIFDGSSWLERLTATAKTFKVPVTAPNFIGATNGVTVSGTPSPGYIPTATSATTATWAAPGGVATASVVPGDLICAAAADTTIQPLSITGGTATGSSVSLNATIAGANYAYLVPGQIVGVTGNSTSGLNGGPYTLTSASGTGLSFASAVAAGSIASGGTIYRWCQNQATDATYSTPQSFSKNFKAIAANGLSAGVPLLSRAQVAVVSSNTAPGVQLYVDYGATAIIQNSSVFGLANNMMYRTGEISFDLVPLYVGTGSNYSGLAGSFQSITLPVSSTWATTYPALTSPINVSTTSAQNLKLLAGYTPTAVASIASASGGSIGGTGTCTLASFNNSCSGSTATVTFSTSGSWSGATFTVTSRGQACTAAPTTATLTSGTATCSGTAAITTTLGGAPGNALDLQSLQ